MIQTGLTYFVCFFCFIEVNMTGTELLNTFEKYHIDAEQSKQVEQILKEQNLLNKPSVKICLTIIRNILIIRFLLN